MFSNGKRSLLTFCVLGLLLVGSALVSRNPATASGGTVNNARVVVTTFYPNSADGQVTYEASVRLSMPDGSAKTLSGGRMLTAEQAKDALVIYLAEEVATLRG